MYSISHTSFPSCTTLLDALMVYKRQLTSPSSTCMHSWYFCKAFHQNQQICFNISKMFSAETMYFTINQANPRSPGTRSHLSLNLLDEVNTTVP